MFAVNDGTHSRIAGPHRKHGTSPRLALRQDRIGCFANEHERLDVVLGERGLFWRPAWLQSSAAEPGLGEGPVGLS
jgi:hypothetical protein